MSNWQANNLDYDLGVSDSGLFGQHYRITAKGNSPEERAKHELEVYSKLLCIRIWCWEHYSI